MTKEQRMRIIGEAIGEASMCWNPRPTGVFDSDGATDVVRGLYEKLFGEEASDTAVIHPDGTVTGGDPPLTQGRPELLKDAPEY